MKVFELTALFLVLMHNASYAQYTPDWPSLDSRPLPAWYDDAKIGIFMHFGPYSVPSVESEWFWLKLNRNESESDYNCLKYMEEYFPPKWTYQDFGPQLTMEFFDAEEFADLVATAGAKYLVFTSKHHDGFCNWNSTYTYGWNSMAIGPERDVLAELKQAFDANYPELHFGVYYSLYEWYNPIYLKDKNSSYTTRNFVLNKMQPEMMEVVNKYEPHIWWSDGEWEASDEYFGSKDFLTWLYNESPVKDIVVTNDRWGNETQQTHGGFYVGPDRYNPGTLQPHKWENAFTVDGPSWGYRRNALISDIFTPEQIVFEIVTTISCGGNVLVNVGPTKEGTIAPIYQERLEVNGEGIYGSIPWTFQNDTFNSDVWYTQNKAGSVIYVFSLTWPSSDILRIQAPTGNITETISTVSMLGMAGDLTYSIKDSKMEITMPSMSEMKRQCPNCDYAYGFKIEHIDAQKTESGTANKPRIFSLLSCTVCTLLLLINM